MLSRKWITKPLIRLRTSAGWSAPLVLANTKDKLARVVALLHYVIICDVKKTDNCYASNCISNESKIYLWHKVKHILIVLLILPEYHFLQNHLLLIKKVLFYYQKSVKSTYPDDVIGTWELYLPKHFRKPKCWFSPKFGNGFLTVCQICR